MENKHPKQRRKKGEAHPTSPLRPSNRPHPLHTTCAPFPGSYLAIHRNPLPPLTLCRKVLGKDIREERPSQKDFRRENHLTRK